MALNAPIDNIKEKIMKITYLLTSFGKTGGPLTIYNFCNGLTKMGHEVYVVTMNEAIKWDFNSHEQFLNDNKNNTTDALIGLLKNLARPIVAPLIKKFNQKKENEKQDIQKIISDISKLLIKNYKKLDIESDIFIASHTYTADAVYRLGRKKKIVIHNQHFEELMFDEDDRAKISMYNYLPFNHIVNCQWLEKMFKHNYGIDAETITPGIDTTIFNTPLNEKKYSNSNRIKLITYCDPTRKFKGFEQQMPILERLSKINKNLEIMIYGQDPKTDLFPYNFLGWVSQQKLAGFYTEAHLALSFSWYESFPLPPIEAMASGCAVAAGRYGTEDYLIDGRSGIVINPFNIEESVNKINNLAQNPKQLYELAANGKKISEKFNWEAQTEKFNKFLLKLSPPTMMDIDKITTGQFSEFEKLN